MKDLLKGALIIFLSSLITDTFIFLYVRQTTRMPLSEAGPIIIYIFLALLIIGGISLLILFLGGMIVVAVNALFPSAGDVRFHINENKLVYLLALTLPLSIVFLTVMPVKDVVVDKMVDKVVKINTAEEVADSGSFKYELITSELKMESTGEDVRILQYLLGRNEDIYPENVISGYFGPATENAVKNFQLKYGLPETGVMDQESIEKFNEVYGNRSRTYYLSAIPIPTPVPTRPVVVTSPDDDREWGVAEQVDEHTWTMKVGEDDRMATPQEIFDALNTYRQREGSPTLGWDDKLAKFAQDRADHFAEIGGTDKHKGFNEFAENIDNLTELGFYHIGENSSYGYQLLGVHLIEWVYAGDAPHDDNQLNVEWDHVGIGVNGTATDLIFGDR